MSISPSEATRGIYGAYRMARFDPSGLDYFDDSREGFVKSFYAAAFVAPFYALLLTIRYFTLEVETEAFRYILVETIGYSVSWTAFPVIMSSLVRLFEREEQYFRYIVAYNWSTIIQNGVFLPIAILSELGAIPMEAGTFFAMIIITAVLFYVWFITRTALEVGPGTAIGIVVFDMLLGVFINGWVQSLL